MRGYLTGSLDAVLRLDGPRYLVVDYKTNWLGDFDADRPLSLWDYRPPALDEVMAESDYPLQAMLYTVALHRFLRWRQPSYDPARHIAGVLYLFRSRNGRARHADRRRTTVWGVRVEAAGRPDHRTVRSARRTAVVIESFAPAQDPFDSRLALTAGGLLLAANAADVLTAADVHVAVRLAQLAGSRTTRFGWPWRWRCVPCATDPCASTSGRPSPPAARRSRGTVAAAGRLA